MNNTPNMLWVVDEEANLIFANNIFLQYFRLDKTALNKNIAELLPLAVADSLYEKHQKVLQTGKPLESVERGKSADGTTTIFRITIFPVEEAGKKLLGGIAINQSEKYSTEHKLEVANERLKQLHRVTSDAIWEWDMQTGEIFRNEKLSEMTGYLPENNRGLTWWLGRVHSEDRGQLNDILKEVTDRSLQSWESEYRFLCADGEYKNMLDRGFVIYENGMPVKMIGSLSDVSSEKLMENLLVEEKLRQFKNISEAALRVQEQERSRLGREMHDNVNQILSTIKLFVGMLTPLNNEEEDLKEKTIEYTLLAIEEIRKLSREMVAPQMEGESLAGHISKVLADIELCTDLKLKFTHDTEIELLSPGKKLTLFRIVQEQLKNILKYSKAKNVEILLQCKNDVTQLIIKDNGIGFNLKKTNSGVGLASIQDRAKFYNGKTEIQSAPGKGCQLMVSIPLQS
jgi:PAS domain S-box-containing protein